LQIYQQTLELLTHIAKHQTSSDAAQLDHKVVGHKVVVLYDELEYAWQQACFNELLIVYEKAKHLSRFVISEQALFENDLMMVPGHSRPLLA
jgi:hypothetical protein